ncbi:Prefoldin [Piptocephalis cylindrospora]|uniref:Prefoldin n=1 Tax=Piptocephalis cylindrospora TaxID=1907219 RepID=A0A4P9Y3A1_9FUNG|nr:Prefoldin [Piptocephalis cylindrospora]RKP13408.1 Prefoldin [Piptocephalis cylindrospora]|eukprot:RKP12415.1 Prefoldin [Piptocephalis cylindrospora]
MSLEARLEAATSAFRGIQQEISTTVETRQRLDSQLSENEQVQKEFGELEEGAQIYKLIGPSLVPQERVEATGNVKKRLEFIKGEIDRVEKLLKDLTAKQEAKKSEVSIE